ncbi:MAG: DEAD/DEAH box helicase [Chloroherpetonaceae bacterium]|nr:DEAD/DEAH box helicase [Chloroherpetonaceae bacterium]
MFEYLVHALKREFENNQDEYAFLIGNLYCNGSEFDAILIKKDAITVLEFKNYSGDIVAVEGGNWTCDGNPILGGNNRNPYQQVRRNKFALLNYLRDYTDFLQRPEQLTQNNLGHITGIVVFKRCNAINDNGISATVKPWFHITDQEHIVDKIKKIASPEIHLTKDQIQRFIKQVHLEASQLPETMQAPAIQVVQDEPPPTEMQPHPKEETHAIQAEEAEQDREMACIKAALSECGFKTVYSLRKNGREPETVSVEGLQLHQNARKFLELFGGKAYKHQYIGLELYKNNKNVCIATSTGSGKSEVFFISAIDLISRNPNARVLAVYPMKALNRQQEERWKDALREAQMSDGLAGRIDGDIDIRHREDIVRKSKIVLITPDVLHSWMLANLHDRNIKNFLRGLRLVVIDEIHTYTGVFGSNSAYLFRRLNHAVFNLGGHIPQYLAASATIDNPQEHLINLTGLNFEVIEKEHETHRTYPVDILMVNANDNHIRRLAQLLNRFANEQMCDNEYRAITFIDSRQVVRLCALIAAGACVDENIEIGDEANDDASGLPIDELNQQVRIRRIQPYIAGLNVEDAETIQREFEQGTIRSVVSTSALEIGLDIGQLDLCILYGIPLSATSFYQRIGRVGRNKRGFVIVINDQSFQSEAYFKRPHSILSIPYSAPKLYLENENIEFINVLCFAHNNCEYENTAQNPDEINVEERANFPAHFVDRTRDLREGQLPKHLGRIRQEVEDVGKSPHLIFPLRDLQSLYEVRWQKNKLGTLSRRYQFREAYPGAIYYYNHRAYRVLSVNHQLKEIRVRPESTYYYTKPIILPPLIQPNFRESVYSFAVYGELKVFETEDNVTESISGYVEQRGDQKQAQYYYDLGFNFRYHSMYLYTSGVHLSHPRLQNLNNTHLGFLSELFFEAFLSVVPIERQDVGFGYGEIARDNAAFPIRSGETFICVYDQTYGSLRLTSPLTNESNLMKVLDRSIEFLNTERAQKMLREKEIYHGEIHNFSDYLNEMKSCLAKNERQEIRAEEEVRVSAGSVNLIRPYQGRGATKNWAVSKGRNPRKELFFYVLSIDWMGRMYRGYYEDSISFDGNEIVTQIGNVKVQPVCVPIQDIEAIPNVSRTMIYDECKDELIDEESKEIF